MAFKDTRNQLVSILNGFTYPTYLSGKEVLVAQYEPVALQDTHEYTVVLRMPTGTPVRESKGLWVDAPIWTIEVWSIGVGKGWTSNNEEEMLATADVILDGLIANEYLSVSNTAYTSKPIQMGRYRFGVRKYSDDDIPRRYFELPIIIQEKRTCRT